ncbi:hypothetical protein LXA43DRAFT_1101617 [Ganoderma leucocontextum]|nr:hypothetical protein LXA43DRAFT_1101617 [Ganoderma leucocontextum]
MTYFYPQFYPCIPMPLPQSDEEIAILRSIIEDTITLAKASINADMALRCTPEDNLWELPLPGRFVRRNKTWIWEPSFSDWAAFLRGGHTCREVDLLKDTIARLKSGFPIPVFLAIVQRGLE